MPHRFITEWLRDKSHRRSQSLRQSLLPTSISQSHAWEVARRYMEFRRSPRLGRGAVTNPELFNTALDVSNRVARSAMRVFHSTAFQSSFRRLSLNNQKVVRNQYAEILRRAAALNTLRRRTFTQHATTPAVLNKAMFLARAREKVSRPSRNAFSVGMIDLDHFGVVNKKFGQRTGDFVLERFTRVLAAMCKRNGGFAGRVGGEEFQFFLPVSPERAKVILDELRVQFLIDSNDPQFKSDLVAEAKIPQAQESLSGWSPVSFTAGIVGGKSHARSLNIDLLLRGADENMREGKRAGRSATIESGWRD
ncbi:MAG: GGDEF domain-containing protein [archaeon]